MGSTMLGVFGAFLITSEFMHRKRKRIRDRSKHSDYHDDQDDDADDNIKFELAFREEFERLERTKIPDKKIIDTFSTELDTPSGTVIMIYNADEETYYYYSDHRNIPIRFLDVVAQKFAIDHDCLELYREEPIEPQDTKTDINKLEELKLEKRQSYYDWLTSKFTWGSSHEEQHTEEQHTEEQHTEEQHTEEQPKEASVFATYKKGRQTTEEKETKKLIDKIMNKYKFGGSIIDYHEKQKEKMNKEFEISFSKFKEMVKNKTE
jgi:ABC-type nickel/cobalt efflux system permease component RcnA